jgi:hypothetical protein
MDLAATIDDTYRVNRIAGVVPMLALLAACSMSDSAVNKTSVTDTAVTAATPAPDSSATASTTGTVSTPTSGPTPVSTPTPPPAPAPLPAPAPTPTPTPILSPSPSPVADVVTLSGIPPTAATTGAAYLFKPSAASTLGYTLAFSGLNLPAWATLNPSTGQLSGTPAAGDVGTTAPISLSVTDGTASAALASFTIAVTALHDTTVALSWNAPTAAADGSSLQLAGYRIYYGTDATALTNVVDIDDPAATAYTVTGLAPGSWYFAMAAYDAERDESNLSDLVAQTL